MKNFFIYIFLLSYLEPLKNFTGIFVLGELLSNLLVFFIYWHSRGRLRVVENRFEVCLGLGCFLYLDEIMTDNIGEFKQVAVSGMNNKLILANLLEIRQSNTLHLRLWASVVRWWFYNNKNIMICFCKYSKWEDLGDSIDIYNLNIMRTVEWIKS